MNVQCLSLTRMRRTEETLRVSNEVKYGLYEIIHLCVTQK